ncbi:MAG: hypothetical protein HOJ17_09545 [Oceanospirillaceae bacterium]|nr:hypothetical protein [Oceanospirillaceae bacterium]
MAMVINTNTASLTTQRHLSSSRGEMEVAMERMSSGSRVNSSMDDAAGLAIGNRMTSQVEGINQAVRNANDGISLAQTAEGALGSSQNILQRMRVLAVQAANDTYSSVDRKAINNEIVQLKEELNRGVNQASFNGNKILNGTNASFTFQVGHMSGDNVVVTLGDMRGSMIGTQSWDPKASSTAPVTVAAVAGITTAGYDNVKVYQVNCDYIISEGFGLLGDINNNCYVDLKDIEMFLLEWLNCMHPDDLDCQ